MEATIADAQKRTATERGTELPPKFKMPSLEARTPQELPPPIESTPQKVPPPIKSSPQELPPPVKSTSPGALIRQKLKEQQERLNQMVERGCNAGERAEEARNGFHEAKAEADRCLQEVDAITATIQDLTRRLQETDRKFLTRRKRRRPKKSPRKRTHAIANRRSRTNQERWPWKPSRMMATTRACRTEISSPSRQYLPSSTINRVSFHQRSDTVHETNRQYLPSRSIWSSAKSRRPFRTSPSVTQIRSCSWTVSHRNIFSLTKIPMAIVKGEVGVWICSHYTVAGAYRIKHGASLSQKPASTVRYCTESY